MEWGQTQDNIRYPRGIILTLPFRIQVKDGAPIRISRNGYDCTLFFRKEITKASPVKEQVPFNLKRIGFVGSKAIGGVHYSTSAILFCDIELTQGNILAEVPHLKLFYEKVITDDKRIALCQGNINTSIIEVALEYMNAFISHYRNESQYFFIPYVQSRSLFAIKFLSLSVDPTTGNLKYGKRDIFPMFDMCGPLPDLEEQQLAAIRSRLKTGEDVSLVDDLILSANDHFAKGSYRLAVIEMETAFEAAIKALVKDHYMRKKRPANQIENILSLGIKDILRDHYRKCDSAKPFHERSDEYKGWHWAYKQRNRVVHEGEDINEEDAFKAFSLFDVTFRYLFDNKGSWITLGLPAIPL